MVGLAFGLLDAISLAAFAVVQGFPFDHWLPARVPRAVNTALSCIRVVDVMLLWQGTIGLLGWKRWSRTVLIVWALLTITLSLGTSIGYFLTSLTAVRAGQPTFSSGPRTAHGVVRRKQRGSTRAATGGVSLDAAAAGGRSLVGASQARRVRRHSGGDAC
jgi:hypothetical protein